MSALLRDLEREEGGGADETGESQLWAVRLPGEWAVAAHRWTRLSVFGRRLGLTLH